MIEKNIKFIEKHTGRKHTIEFDERKKYIIVIRNPISRFISAFNWRYKLVVEDGTQKDRFEGEKELLEKFNNVNQLAENLYDTKGNLLVDFSKPEFYIHHLKEDISYYLSNLLKECPKDNIVAVITTEKLKDDMKTYLDIDSKKHEKNNSNKKKMALSELGYHNLKKYLHKDYECIDKLYDLGAITKDRYEVLSV